MAEFLPGDDAMQMLEDGNGRSASLAKSANKSPKSSSHAKGDGPFNPASPCFARVANGLASAGLRRSAVPQP
jgi:hypothetical protein